MRTPSWIAAALTLLIAPVTSQAITILDLKGTGTVCTIVFGSPACNSPFTGDIFGTVTIQVLASAPAGPDSFVSPDGLSQEDRNGWVVSSYSFRWAGGSFNSGTVPGQTYGERYAQVFNGAASDSLFLNSYSERSCDNCARLLNYATLERYSGNGDWLTGLDFIEQLGLAPNPGSDGNRSKFENSSRDSATQVGTGFYGTAVWTEAIVTSTLPTRVPEPGTLMLLVVGCLGMAAVRRLRPA